jgi:hypothetical protein
MDDSWSLGVDQSNSAGNAIRIEGDGDITVYDEWRIATTETTWTPNVAGPINGTVT